MYPCPVSSSDTNPSTGDAQTQNRYNNNIPRKQQASKYAYTSKLAINGTGLAFSPQHVHCPGCFPPNSSCCSRQTEPHTIILTRTAIRFRKRRCHSSGDNRRFFLLRMQLFDPSFAYMEFSANRVALGQVFLRTLRVSPTNYHSISAQYSSIIRSWYRDSISPYS
jgi:hypothetical protein